MSCWPSGRSCPRTGMRAQYVFPAPKADSKTPYMSLPVATMDAICKAIGYTISSHDFAVP